MTPDTPFDVPISGAISDLVRRLYDQAVSDGRRRDFLDAYRTITARLESSADTFGEELFALPRLGVVVRVALVAPLSVLYSLHPVSRLVTIGDVTYTRPRSR
ncbi:hypothetical protein [Urbifossiella limnaea]|uniref:Uncharacterized protein n=1 Tax=Urbifossiella limnaea TaxID=2528023 RepID=A0A517XLB2_9BACT|nr:hypothetical protein [Urbifossiella limnaea]QDU18297.1 hypothetical protein ETAA1_01820 [Urbifossiella limnaea]